MTVKVTSKLVEGLTDGFTGEPLEVMMTVTAGTPPLYNCPDAFSVHVPHGSLEALRDDVSMKDGVRGLRDSVHPKCPYTGEDLLLRVFPDGRFAYKGGLNPRVAYKSLEELRYWLSMRDGKSPYVKPGPQKPVTKPERAGRELAEENVPSDATREVTEKIVAEHMPRGTQVSMAGASDAGKAKGKPKGKPKGGGRR